MSLTKRALLVILAFGLLAVAAAPHYHRTRPCVRCSIPDRDYLYGNFSQPLISLSSTPVVLTDLLAEGSKGALYSAPAAARAEGDRPKQRAKSFQFVKNPTLTIDHCSISQMSVLLHESGRFTVSLRADQNPPGEQQPLNVTTIEPNRRFTYHLKRNQFHVVARCYVDYGPVRPNALLGKPMVIQLPIDPFWVQKEEPYQLFESDFHPHVQQYFDSIDRVEIEFAYKRD